MYNVGMYGGSFNPLHLGHIDCIIQSANMCEKLYLVLSCGKNRDEIDYKIRYRWLYQLTKHIGNVEIIIITDEATSKEEYTQELWNKDAQKIKKEIGEPIDVVFCGSDYDENSFWKKCYPESELFIFQRNEMSSTAIRSNPYKHWDWIPNIVKPHYVKKVLLIGGESTGKSTLTINLANRFNTNYIDETGKEISVRSGSDDYMLSEDFTEILLQQKLNEMKALRFSNKILFIDTDSLVTQFYMGFLNDEDIERNKNLSNAIDALNSYDLILFLEPDVPFVMGDDRNEEICNNREKYSDEIKQILKNHSKEFIVLNGDYQTRYKMAEKEVLKLFTTGSD